MIWPLVAAAAAAFALLKGKASISIGDGPHAVPPHGAPVADWHDAIAEAIASGDPKRMRALADKLDAEGLTQAAADLRHEADLAAAGHPSAPADGGFVPSGPAGLTHPQPQAPPAASVPPPPPNTPPNGLEQALALSRHLAATGRGHENKTLVRAFQKLHGLTADGMYGADTASHIADFGIVPPTPFYWPKKLTATRVKQYKQMLLDKAGSDPAQAAQWIAAANKVKV